MWIARMLGLLVVTALVWPTYSLATNAKSVVGAKHDKRSRATYPGALVGQWEPYPDPCRLPLQNDSDMGFVITPRLLRGYEHTDTPTKVERISRSPQAWRIEATENYGGEKAPVVDIYVLSGDYLTVTDGARSTQFNRCR